MSIAMTSAAIQAVSGITWEWSDCGVAIAAQELGWQMIEEVGSKTEGIRRTYSVSDGLKASAYSANGTCDFLEITLDVFLNPDELDAMEYENKVDEYFAKFEEATRLATDVLGKPIFSDGTAGVGFPEDQEAVWLSLWKTETARIMIQQKHEDKELPFRVCIVIAPPM